MCPIADAKLAAFSVILLCARANKRSLTPALDPVVRPRDLTPSERRHYVTASH